MNNKCENAWKTIKIYSNVSASSYCLQTVVKGTFLSRYFREMLYAWSTVSFITWLAPACSVSRKDLIAFPCFSPKNGTWFYERLCKHILSYFTKQCQHVLPLHEGEEKTD